MIDSTTKPKDFIDIIFRLQNFWEKQGCSLILPYNTEVGAGTFSPFTVLESLSNKPSNYAYVQGCNRPTDGRYGDSPNRLQYYYQFQVLMKPAPCNIQEIYLESLKELGINVIIHDIRFVEDDWESPTLGAFGCGWEVWCDGMEITQFTYFQQIGGIIPKQTPVEITYGLERIAMYILDINNVYDLPWNSKTGTTYKDIFFASEKEFSDYNFNYANINNLLMQFNIMHEECEYLILKGLVYPAYNMAAKASHFFNLLDARGALGVNERALYIQKIQELVKKCCELYVRENE